MPKHIGIVAVSPEGSALCYRDVFRYAAKRLGERGHPVVTLHNMPLEQYVSAVYRDDWHTIGELLAASAKVLAAAGAEFAIVPDNLMQHGVHLAEPVSPIPWLTMTELVTEAIVADGRKAVGIVGTKMVMFGSTYQIHLGLKGIRYEVPDEAEADIQRRYLERSAALHPDRLEPTETRGIAPPEEERAAEINRARQVVEDPEQRAAALWRLWGGVDHKALPPGFLMEMMEVRQEIEGAHDPAAIAQWEAWAEERRREHQQRVGGLFERLTPGGASNAEVLKAIRMELNAWRYTERLVEQLGAP